MIVLISILMGIYKINESHPVFIDLLLLIVGWQGAIRGGWRWARFIPPIVCFLLGTYSLGGYNIENTSILLYGFAVILSGFFTGQPNQFSLCYSLFNYVYLCFMAFHKFFIGRAYYGISDRFHVPVWISLNPVVFRPTDQSVYPWTNEGPAGF